MLKMKLLFIVFLSGISLTCLLPAAKNVNALSYSEARKYSFKNRFLIHKLQIKSGLIYKLNTAPGYVSVITLPTIPLDVAVGNTAAFSEQVVGKQIFIKPITYNTHTTSNIEIFTKFGLINILVRIKNPASVTYNLNLADTLKNIFVENYIKNKINGLKAALYKEYNSKMKLLNIKSKRIKKEKKEVMGLILAINRTRIDKSVRKAGITLTVISISRIKNYYYLEYQLTNNDNLPFFIRNIYLYRETGGDFLNGYNPDVQEEIYALNHAPHNVQYMPYKIIKKVIIFKKTGIKLGNNLRLSVHLLLKGRLIKLKVGDILL